MDSLLVAGYISVSVSSRCSGGILDPLFNLVIDIINREMICT
jgi:hypothetical protein